MFTAPQLRAGPSLTHGRLTVFPLFVESPTPVPYRLADDALADGTAVVEEVSEGGNVPYLSVENRGGTPVLFLEGQELRGAKQNRVLNTTILVAANAKTVLPVSCVEQGRWHYTSRHFAGSDGHSSTKLRSVLKASVGGAARAGRGHGSDQGAVWAEVGRQMSSHGAASATMAMSDTYAARRADVDEHVSRLAYPDGATGLAVAVGSRVVAVDVFDRPETCRKVWSRLLTGAAMDAMEAADAAAPGEDAVRAAVDVLRIGPWQAVQAAGVGEEYRCDSGGRWHGSVLARDGTVIHGSLVVAG
jgi:hypothetical protein